MQGSTWKDSSESDLRAEGSRSRIPYENIPTRQTEKYESVRKSKRVPKKRSLDGVFDDTNDVDDDEIDLVISMNRNSGIQMQHLPLQLQLCLKSSGETRMVSKWTRVDIMFTMKLEEGTP